MSNVNFNYSDLEQLLNSITAKWCHSEKSMEYFKTNGVNPNHWPDCEAKSILVKLEKELTTKTFDRCVFDLQGRHFTLPQKHSDLDKNIIVSFYQDLIKIHLARVLSRNIAERPDRAEFLIKEFLEKKITSIEVLDAKYTLPITMEAIKEKARSGDAIKRINKWPFLSDFIGGFNPDRVTMISAVSGRGKTKLALSLWLDARYNFDSVYYNMEMNQEDFESMIICNLTKTENTDLRSGNAFSDKMNEKKITDIVRFNAMETREDALQFTCGAALTIEQLIGDMTNRFANKNNCMAFIDYDQKIVWSGKDEEWKYMVKIVEKLEQAARELRCHVIMLFQESDNGDPRSSKRALQPVSTAISFTKNANEQDVLRFKKNRHGPTNKDILVKFYPGQSRVEEASLIEQVLTKEPLTYTPPKKGNHYGF